MCRLNLAFVLAATLGMGGWSGVMLADEGCAESGLFAIDNRTALVDFDTDYDVDADDLAVFEICSLGPAVPRNGTGLCQQADFDDDNDVDQSDFGVFQRCYSGSEVLADAGCAE